MASTISRFKPIENPPEWVYDKPPKGMNNLWDKTREVWYEKITVEECQKVISSMPYRVEACIKAKGYGIDY